MSTEGDYTTTPKTNVVEVYITGRQGVSIKKKLRGKSMSEQHENEGISGRQCLYNQLGISPSFFKADGGKPCRLTEEGIVLSENEWDLKVSNIDLFNIGLDVGKDMIIREGRIVEIAREAKRLLECKEYECLIELLVEAKAELRDEQFVILLGAQVLDGRPINLLTEGCMAESSIYMIETGQMDRDGNYLTD